MAGKMCSASAPAWTMTNTAMSHCMNWLSFPDGLASASRLILGSCRSRSEKPERTKERFIIAQPATSRIAAHWLLTSEEEVALQNETDTLTMSRRDAGSLVQSKAERLHGLFRILAF